MHIKRLILHNFRNYAELSIEPDPGLNILLGRNAQGKTSFLEAIYVIALARSWRAGRDSELVRWESDQARVSAEVGREEQNDISVEVILGRSEKKQVLINTIRQTRLADLMGQVNVLLIEPHDVEIVRGEPSHRRRFMNLEISQVQPLYCHLLVNYRKVLEQRNRLLKDLQARGCRDGVMEVLNVQLVDYGSKILDRRLNFVSRIAGLARDIHSRITEGSETMETKYHSRTSLDAADAVDQLAERLRSRLEEVRDEEIRRGITLVGPQRDDLIFTVNGVDARVYGSQGQQRTIALSLRLAELELMNETAKEPPIILLDDVMTDLDEGRRKQVFDMTRGRCQIFVTAASKRVFDHEFLAGGRVYRVAACGEPGRAEGQVTPE